MKLENLKVQSFRIKLKMNELLEYKTHVERFEGKLDMCIETEVYVTSAPWWPTNRKTSEEDTEAPRRTRNPIRESTPPYYRLIGTEYYQSVHSDEFDDTSYVY